VKVVALVGRSGSGKTTAILSLIAHFVAIGQTVGTIKHTHHPLNEEDRGDTAKMRRAGADPVILAGNGGEAVVFSGSGTRRIRYDTPRDLLEQIPAQIVFVEGFKAYEDWPRIELDEAGRRSAQELLEILDRIWRP
jgi:molybdopterin-guanine dinucleotide biosynthesis adapter protein